MDWIEPGPESGSEPDAAEQAFAALRAEVAALRQGIERVYQQGEAARRSGDGPDYSPTLGAMAKELHGIGARLRAIEGKPGLALTQTALDGPTQQASEDARRALSLCQGKLTAAVAEVRTLAGQVRARQTQQSWLAVTGLLGLLCGACLWFMLIGLLPGSAGAWLAALSIGGGPWHAGQVLLQDAAPASWDRMVRLYKACPADSAVELCEAAMTARPAGSQSEPAPTSAPGPAPAPLHGHVRR